MVLDRDAELTSSGRPRCLGTMVNEAPGAGGLPCFASGLVVRSDQRFRICRPAARDETRFRHQEGAWT